MLKVLFYIEIFNKHITKVYELQLKHTCMNLTIAKSTENTKQQHKRENQNLATSWREKEKGSSEK